MLQFTDATELKAHYATLKAKFRGPRVATYVTIAPPPPPPPVVEPPKPHVFVGPDMSKFPKEVIDEFNKTFRNSPKSRMKRILIDTSEKYGVSVEDMLSTNRGKSLVVARQEAIYRTRTEVGRSLAEIGRYYNKDHSTVFHAITAHQKRMMR